VPRYGRVVLKLSGEALAGPGGWGVDPPSLAHLAAEVLLTHDLGLEVAVVVGGGSYFRGRMAEGWGIGRAEADNIGMLGTVMNGLMLRGALTARSDTDIRVMTAIPTHSVAESYIPLRALSHLRHGAIVLLAGGIGQPYVTTTTPLSSGRWRSTRTHFWSPNGGSTVFMTATRTSTLKPRGFPP
jgi:uridylate kinase